MTGPSLSETVPTEPWKSARETAPVIPTGPPGLTPGEDGGLREPGTGHKTRLVFERHNIVSDGDLTEAARKLDLAAAMATAPQAASISR